MPTALVLRFRSLYMAWLAVPAESPTGQSLAVLELKSFIYSESVANDWPTGDPTTLCSRGNSPAHRSQQPPLRAARTRNTREPDCRVSAPTVSGVWPVHRSLRRTRYPGHVRSPVQSCPSNCGVHSKAAAFRNLAIRGSCCSSFRAPLLKIQNELLLPLHGSPLLSGYKSNRIN